MPWKVHKPSNHRHQKRSTRQQSKLQGHTRPIFGPAGLPRGEPSKEASTLLRMAPTRCLNLHGAGKRPAAVQVVRPRLGQCSGRQGFRKGKETSMPLKMAPTCWFIVSAEQKNVRQQGLHAAQNGTRLLINVSTMQKRHPAASAAIRTAQPRLGRSSGQWDFRRRREPPCC